MIQKPKKLFCFHYVKTIIFNKNLNLPTHASQREHDLIEI